MDSIGSILGGQKPQKQPKEIMIIKEFIAHEFQEPCSITMHHDSIAITVANGAFASQLQLRLSDLYKLVGTSKKLYIRIGSV